MRIFECYKSLTRIALLFLILLPSSWSEAKVGGGASKNNLSVAMLPVDFESLDPAKIVIARQYIMLAQLYSTLISVDKSGEIIPGIASSYSWQGNKLIFTIRKDVVTKDGWKITPEDAAFSLRRVLKLSSTTHGDLTLALCGQPESKSKPSNIEEACNSISYTDDKLILDIKGSKNFVVQMLSSIDFAVIPKKAVNKETLKIEDLKNTTGAYYIISQKKNSVLLGKNDSFQYFEAGSPDSVSIDFTDDEKKSFVSGNSDVVITTNNVPTDELLKLHDKAKTNLFETVDIKLVFGFFVKPEKFGSADERIAFGSEIRESFLEVSRREESHRKPTDRFFPKFGEGDLTPAQDLELKKVLGSKKAKNLKAAYETKTIRIGHLGLGQIGEQWASKFKKSHKSIEIVKLKNLPREEDNIDFCIAKGDSGFFEDMSLLSYYSAIGVLFNEEPKAKEFLNNYSKIASKPERLNMLKQLHYDIIASGQVVPMSIGPYYSLSRKPWKIKLSPYFANFNAWQIIRDQSND